MISFNNFKYGLTLANELYDIDLDEDTYEELALIAWNKIGNKRCKLYRWCTSLNCSNLTIELPCNADIIEAVTYGFEDYDYTSNKTHNGQGQFTESYIESSKPFNDNLYISGRYAEYERVGDTLYFNRNYGTINILYKGVIVDEDGLPELTDKEAEAIATYCAYTLKYKEGLKTNNANIIQIAQQLKRDWYIAVDQARIPEYLNQNDMDEILDVRVRYDRKIFNKSYKPIHK